MPYREPSGLRRCQHGKKLQKFFTIPYEIQNDFWHHTLKKNTASLSVVSLMIIGMETYNIFRVLFLSRSGLSSVNNRIYFGMYSVLFLSAILFLFLERASRHGSVRLQWAFQYGCVLFFLLWNVGLNTYDLMQNPDAEILVLVTAFWGLAMFVQMPALYSIFCYSLGYILFIIFAGPILTSGTVLNLTFSTLAAAAVSITNCRHAVDMLLQHRELDLTNQRLQELLQTDPLTGILTKAAFQERAELSLSSCGPERPLVMFIADFDKFKLINDHYGHPCGDYVLAEMGRILKEVFPNAIGIGRLGGDEFAAVMKAGVFSRHLSRLSWNGEPLDACCSMGVCRLSRAGVSYGQAYKEADSALYTAKKKGRGSCHLCELT